MYKASSPDSTESRCWDTCETRSCLLWAFRGTGGGPGGGKKVGQAGEVPTSLLTVPHGQGAQSESQVSCSVGAATAEARLSSWPFSLSPAWMAERVGG